MASKRVQSLAKRLQASIENIVHSSYQEIEEVVQLDYDSYQRQIDSYKKKAQVVDIAARYLKNGTKAVSAGDRKKVGATYAKKLEQVVNFNKRYQKAKESAKEASGLKRKVTTLENAKSRLQTRYDNQKKRYDARIANIQKKYDGAEFLKTQIAKLRGMSLREYQTKIKTDASEKAFIESTHYNGKPTEVTYILQDNIGLIKTRNRIQTMKEIAIARINAVREGKDPDEAQRKIESKGSKPKKSKKKKK
jgi:hypothetical protein